MRVSTLFCGHPKGYGVGYACQSIVGGMASAGAEVDLYCVSADKAVIKPYFRPLIPVWGQAIGYRLFKPTSIQPFLESRYLRHLKAGDIAYIWPGASAEVYRIAQEKGCVLVTENINTHTATSKQILDQEYARLGLPPAHSVDAGMIADENAKLALVDYVFSPSPEVSRSLCAAGVPEAGIIESSYGMNIGDILPVETIPARKVGNAALTALFVGRVGIRKGVHLLLEYWVKAGVPGILKLVGNIEEDARHLIEPYLQHPGIQHIPFSTDLKQLYQDADVFIFPSLEEGSPLVTYLALGAGLPALVSPMGGGGVVEDGVNGWVMDPHDVQAWVESIRKAFFDVELRHRYSDNAHAKAPYYVWQDVGARRYRQLVAM